MGMRAGCGDEDDEGDQWIARHFQSKGWNLGELKGYDRV